MKSGKHEAPWDEGTKDGPIVEQGTASAPSDIVNESLAADTDTDTSDTNDVATLQAALANAQVKGQQHYDDFLRAKAESENMRRRAIDDVAKAHKFGIENFAESLLPVMDSLQAALGANTSDASTLREGVELTRKQLHSAFERNRLIVIDPVGEKFDPHRHQAIATVPAPEGVAPNHVVTVLQKGWMLADRVLRPALVTVAS